MRLGFSPPFSFYFESVLWRPSPDAVRVVAIELCSSAFSGALNPLTLGTSRFPNWIQLWDVPVMRPCRLYRPRFGMSGEKRWANFGWDRQRLPARLALGAFGSTRGPPILPPPKGRRDRAGFFPPPVSSSPRSRRGFLRFRDVLGQGPKKRGGDAPLSNPFSGPKFVWKTKAPGGGPD
jgi:hypothetical protein